MTKTEIETAIGKVKAKPLSDRARAHVIRSAFDNMEQVIQRLGIKDKRDRDILIEILCESISTSVNEMLKSNIGGQVNE